MFYSPLCLTSELDSSIGYKTFQVIFLAIKFYDKLYLLSIAAFQITLKLHSSKQLALLVQFLRVRNLGEV